LSRLLPTSPLFPFLQLSVFIRAEYLTIAYISAYPATAAVEP